MPKLLRIVEYTVLDIIRQKSFYVLLGVGVGFVLLLRSCYSGNYSFNGKTVDAVTVAWNASIIAFHVVAAGALLIAAMLSMGLFSRDREDGTLHYMLSKPVARSAYALGRVLGVWLVSFCFMFVLHLAIFVITLISAGGTMPGYLVASCLCSINVLFAVLLVCSLSLVAPDFAAAVIGIGILVVSYVADTLFNVAQSKFGQALLANGSFHVPPWEMVWPKICSFQTFAVSFIDNSAFRSIGPVHPALLMAVWICIAAGALLLVFEKREL